MALSDEILARTPLGYWRTVDGADSSGNSLPLTPFGGPTAGASLDLSDPGDASITLQDERNLWNPEFYADFDLTAAFAIFFLVSSADVGGDNYDLVRKHQIYGATLNTDAKAHAVVTTADLTVHDLPGTTTIAENTRYSVGVNYDGTTLTLYVNGVQDATLAVAAPLLSQNNRSFTVGSSGVGGFQGMAGLIDEVALFDAALTGADFLAFHEASSTGVVVTARYSGGADNAQGSLSLGGAEGQALVSSANALFAAPTNAQRLAGLTDYRCLYLHAPDTGLTDLAAWVETPSSQTDTAEAIGEDPSNPAQTIAAATTAPTAVSFSAPAEGSAFDLGDLADGEAVPLWVRRTVDAGAAAGTRTLTLGLSWVDFEANPQTLEIDISYTVTVPVTLYVDADHADRSDAWTREQAADDPDSPFASMQAAALLLQSGDTMQVEPSTLGQANPADANDTDVYTGIHHLRNTDGSDVLPAALNGAGDPIRIVGHVVDGVRPKVLRFEFRELDNWQFEGFQRGYDRGSGDDFGTVNVLHNCKDLAFEDIIYTGGGNYCIGGRGTMSWADCEVYSEFVGSGSFLDGAGFHFLGVDTSTGISSACVFSVTGCHFEDVEGEDAIQAALGHGHDIHLVVDDCTFQDIVQGALTGAPHTDCIQTTGASTVTVTRCQFVGCSSPFIASDGLHDRITLLDNLVDGIGNGFHGQGCSEWVIVNNTIQTPGIAVAIGDRTNQFIPDFEQHLTIVNNIISSYDIAAGAVIDAASVFADNMLLSAPGHITDWGTQIDGLPEFGTSARLDTAGIDGNFELANDPVDSSGIGDGRSLSGLGLTDDELAVLATDLLGRAFANPRDVGALQSDPGTPVTPAPRPAYVINRSPASGSTGISRGTDVTFRLVPPPGQEIDPETVTTSTVYVSDATAHIHLPATVTLGALADGSHLVTVDLLASTSPETEGELLPLVLYDVVIDGPVDTEGSEVPATSWSFRAAGTGGPAIDGGATTDDFVDDAPQTYSISGRKGDRLIVTHTEMRFPAGTELSVWEVTADREITGSAVATGVVSADFSVAFGGLEVDRHYVTGPSLSGPFSLFRVYG